jgi:hypothetical protein
MAPWTEFPMRSKDVITAAGTNPLVGNLSKSLPLNARPNGNHFDT